MKFNENKVIILMVTGAAMIIFGLFLSWPFGFSWHRIIVTLIEVGPSPFLLITFIVSAGAVALLLHAEHPVMAEWVGAAATFALFYPLVALAATLPQAGSWADLFITSGALGLALAQSAWAAIAVFRQWLGRPKTSNS